MLFLNDTGLLGMIITHAATHWVGSLEATMIMIFIVVMLLALAFQIPLELVSVIILPLCIVTATQEGKFFIPIVLIAIYVGFIIAKNWLVR